MAKRPLSVELRPSSAVFEQLCNHDVTTQRRRLSMNDVSLLSADDTTPSGRHRISPTSLNGCRRPIASALPRLNLSLIKESSLWTDQGCATTTASSRGTSISVSGSNDSCSVTSSCVDHTALVSSVEAKTVDANALCPPTTSSSSSSSKPASAADMTHSTSDLTYILPFLYLGSQLDALSSDVIAKNGIEYIVNVSSTSPQCPFVSESKFLRIPVNDGHTDRLLPFFSDAFKFLDSVRQSSGRVLVHCLAGISRSPTIVIGYVMKHLHLSIDDAYRFVKQRRPTISPNFNFLGQLVEYDSILTSQRNKHVDVITPADGRDDGDDGRPVDIQRSPSPNKRPCRINVSRPGSAESHSQSSVVAQSPTVALARLQFSPSEHRVTLNCSLPLMTSSGDVTTTLISHRPPPVSCVAVCDAVDSHNKCQRTKVTASCSNPLMTSLKSAAPIPEVTSDALFLQWQTTCKSRSLEDILLMTSCDVTNVTTGGTSLTSSYWTGERSDDLSDSMTTLGNGNGGSAGSLRGSVEIIQVS